ncbi:hypothetical protein NDU88_005177 [Pleurodeles waltl]|uniref:Uncharacterized protein n=1 Tax=Pleurodeles waltl TaxID=8319 RepID=A0AAV7VIA4_PLEWA|nr:hypothetical protein NDU88_005177 [Pleurodeles waltl]
MMAYLCVGLILILTRVPHQGPKPDPKEDRGGHRGRRGLTISEKPGESRHPQPTEGQTRALPAWPGFPEDTDWAHRIELWGGQSRTLFIPSACGGCRYGTAEEEGHRHSEADAETTVCALASLTPRPGEDTR